MPTITDIFAESRKSVEADSISYPDADLLRRVNMAEGEIEADLMTIDNNWNFGNSNNTTLTETLKTLTAGTKYYAFDAAMMMILGVSVKDIDLIWHPLSLIDDLEILKNGIDLAEYQKTDGLPIEYAKRENFIIVYPGPAAAKVTLTSGLKIYSQAIGTLFTAADITTGTKTPGFASPYHYELSYRAALPYAAQYKKDRVAWLISEIKRLSDARRDFYSKRGKDEKAVMRNRGISFR